MTQLKKTFLLFSLTLLSAVLIGVTAGGFYAFLHDLPEIRSLNTFRPSSITRIYSSDNVILSELFTEKRDPVALSQMPDLLIKALIATEDQHFYQHNGVYIKGILRALIKDIIAGEFVEGASTITQQLSKTLFLTSKKTITRKIQEAFLSFQLERRYTKDEILTFYLNQVYFGSGAYGVKSAASIYFNKDITHLNLQESAMLIAMLKAPSRYSPHKNRELAKTRRNVVLRQMFNEGIITKDALEQALESPIEVVPQKRRHSKAEYFVDYIKTMLPEDIDTKSLYQNGLTIHTTLRYDFQEYAVDAMQAGLDQLKKRMASQGKADPSPQAALICIDVNSGKILAMNGGVDYGQSQYNRATTALRQPGSAFKPLLFALAVEKGFPQNKLILDAPISFTGSGPGNAWTPQNFSRDYKGEMTLREALAKSKNIPAVRLIDMLGVNSVVEFAHSLGIKARLRPNLSLALGTSEVNLINLTAAYAVFPNRGEYIEPYGIVKISDHTGQTLWQASPQKKIVMSRPGAAIMTNMLEAVIQEGTGRRARHLHRPMGGKTGTTDECKDALFVGFTPSVATGVWVGIDTYHSLGRKETGARAALPIWTQFMANVIQRTPYAYFDIPDDTVKVMIHPKTGKRIPMDAPGGVPALFRKGTEPKM